jgi:hypothetical protein
MATPTSSATAAATPTSRQLRTGAGGFVGEALVRAKLGLQRPRPTFAASTRRLLEATLFGLPMLAVNMPGSRDGNRCGAQSRPSRRPPGSASAARPRWADDRRTDRGMTLTPRAFFSRASSRRRRRRRSPRLVEGRRAWSQLQPSGAAAGRAQRDADDGQPVLRGVGFRGGNYADDVITPLTDAPTNWQRHVPFVSPVFYRYGRGR